MMARYGYTGSLYGHFGQGCVHTRINFDLKTAGGHRRATAGSSRRRPIWWSRYGGSLSGEHGDGQSRAELLPRMYGDELMQAFREFKAHLGPGRTG